MQIRIGLENNNEGRSVAWALDFPGCFAYGTDEAEALIRLPQAILQYDAWIKDHTTQPWIDFVDMDMRVVERIGEEHNPTSAGEGHEVINWFVDDRRPLNDQEIEHALLVFQWQREELLAGLTTLDPQILEKEHPGQRWSILGIARHIANAELWYLSRLDLTALTYKELHATPESRLKQTADQIKQIFPNFIGAVNVEGIEGEFWSYRKIVRRTLWHQRDHIDHIKELAFNQ